MIYLVVFGMSCLILLLSEKINLSQEIVISETGRDCKKCICFFLTVTALCIPALLAGLRDSSIGTDVELYGNAWFLYAKNFDFVSYIKMASEQSIGVFYAFINYAVALVTDNESIFYFTLSLIETILIYLGLRGFHDKISVPFAMFCYYTILYNNTLNLLRQSLAIAIVCFSYRFLLKDKYLIFFLLTILAILSHSTAIFTVILPVGWLYLKHCNNKSHIYIFNIVLFLVTACIMLLYKPFLKFCIAHHILSERFLTYISSTSVVGGRMIRLFFWLLLAVFAYFSFSKMIKYDARNKFVISCLTLSLAFSLIMFMGNVYAIRLAYYFDAAVFIFIPMIPKVYKPKIDGVGYMKYTMYLLLILILIVRWYLEYVHSLNGATYPYRFAS